MIFQPIQTHEPATTLWNAYIHTLYGDSLRDYNQYKCDKLESEMTQLTNTHTHTQDSTLISSKPNLLFFFSQTLR